MFRLPGLLLLNTGDDHNHANGGDGSPKYGHAEESGFTVEDVEACVETVLGKTDDDLACRPVRLSREDLKQRAGVDAVEAGGCGGGGGGTDGGGEASKLLSGSAVARATGSTFGEMLLEPHLVATKLALMVATMRHCGVRRLRYQPAIGSCAGLLVHPAFFPAPTL